MDWDAEVDVLCVGAGIGGLATAIAAVDAAADVMGAGALHADDGRWLRGDDVHCVTLGATLDARIDEFGVPRGIPDDEPAPEAGGPGEVEAAEPDLGEQLDATAVYFAAVTAEVDDAAEPPSDGASVPARVVRELTESETHTRTIETFFGAGLCVNRPSGASVASRLNSPASALAVLQISASGAPALQRSADFAGDFFIYKWQAHWLADYPCR